MSFERTPYDYEMLKNYNQSGSFNTQPWPTPRTAFDKALQDTWCPTCKHPIPPPYPNPPHPSPPAPGPHPHPVPPGPYGPQPRHGGTNHLMENYASVMQTPQGNVRNPYQACGNTHSSGPASMPSTWEPMQMAMGANTECCCADPSQEQCTRTATGTILGCSQGSCPQDQYCFKTQNGEFTDQYC